LIFRYIYLYTVRLKGSHSNVIFGKVKDIDESVEIKQGDIHMFQVDRVAAVVRPTEKMMNFLKKQAGYRETSGVGPQKDCTILLIPQFEGPGQATAYIKGMAQAIFEGELASWDIDSSLWPKDRSYATFSQWFSVEYHSLIYDLVLLEAHLAEMG
jgi:hypothetical protein